MNIRWKILSIVVVLLVLSVFLFGKNNIFNVSGVSGVILAQSSGDTSVALKKALASGSPVVLEFYSDGWGACIKVKPVVNRMEEKYKGKIIVLRADTSVPSNGYLGRQYGIRYIPTFEFFDSKGKLVDTKVGYMNDSELDQKMALLLK